MQWREPGEPPESPPKLSGTRKGAQFFIGSGFPRSGWGLNDPLDALCVFAQQVISSPHTLQQKSVAVQCFLRIAQAVLRQPELAIDDLVTFLVRPSGKPRSTDSRSSWWRVHNELIEAVKARTGHHPDDIPSTPPPRTPRKREESPLTGKRKRSDDDSPARQVNISERLGVQTRMEVDVDKDLHLEDEQMGVEVRDHTGAPRDMGIVLQASTEEVTEEVVLDNWESDHDHGRDHSFDHDACDDDKEEVPMLQGAYMSKSKASRSLPG